jgi:hypothetical protein
MAARGDPGRTGSDGRFVLRGNLYDFPFVDNKGACSSDGKGFQCGADYADHWPKIETSRPMSASKARGLRSTRPRRRRSGSR